MSYNYVVPGSKNVSIGCKNSQPGYYVFTDFNPNCKLNEQYQLSYGRCNTHNYRQFLQHNALSLMNGNRLEAEANSWNYCHCNADSQLTSFDSNEYPNRSFCSMRNTPASTVYSGDTFT
jgi:hypothetical protein